MSLTVWAITLASLAVVLAFDFALAFYNRNKATSLRTAIAWTLFYVALAVGFGLSLGMWSTETARSEFFAGWLTEYSLSFDNLFLFILILARLKVPKEREQLVLLIGIVASLFLRGIFIAVGSVVVHRFQWIFFFFGLFLIYTAYTLAKESEDEEWREGRIITFFRNKGTSTFVLALIAVASTDVIFAFDSIPAIFGLTKNPYIIVTANVFALMGLRQLYFLIGGLMSKLIYLTEGLAFLLAFIGSKLILEAAASQGVHKILGIHLPEISLSASLFVIIGTLATTAVISLLKQRRDSSGAAE